MKGANVFYEFAGVRSNVFCENADCNLDLYEQISAKEVRHDSPCFDSLKPFELFSATLLISSQQSLLNLYGIKF